MSELDVSEITFDGLNKDGYDETAYLGAELGQVHMVGIYRVDFLFYTQDIVGDTNSIKFKECNMYDLEVSK